VYDGLNFSALMFNYTNALPTQEEVNVLRWSDWMLHEENGTRKLITLLIKVW
jgi:hypothetical protein